MTRVLTAGRKEALSGSVKSVVVLLHGYGANGADLLGIADILAEHLPDTLFIAPDAPETCPGAPMGYQWFPIPWLDGSSEEAAQRSMDAAVEDLNAFLDALMVDEDILPEQLALFGFSQGTMMSLHVAPRREDQIAGIVAFSGRLIDPELLIDDVKTKDEESFLMARRLIKEEGLLIGGSSGSAMVAAMQAAKKLNKQQKCLIILPDSIRNYITKFPNDGWMKQNGFKT